MTKQQKEELVVFKRDHSRISCPHSSCHKLQRFSSKSRYWLGKQQRDEAYFQREITRDFHAHTHPCHKLQDLWLEVVVVG